MIRTVPATQIEVGSQVVERDGYALEVTAVRPVGRRIEFTMRSLSRSGIKAVVSSRAMVRVPGE